jgi:hypothetical protein
MNLSSLAQVSASCIGARHHGFSVLALLLAVLISACGGGGGGGSPGDTAPPPTGGGTTPPTTTPPPTTIPPTIAGPTAQTLLAHLSACANTPLVFSYSPLACMVGEYEGKTTDSGAPCVFKYASNGYGYLLVGGQTVASIEGPSSSPALFEKIAASNSAGFSIVMDVDTASDRMLTVHYFSSSKPASANGLLIQVPRQPTVPSCLVAAGPVMSPPGAASTANLLGKTWQSPQLLNGTVGAVTPLSDRPAFDAGLAEDGRAFIAFRQPDANGRLAVYVVEGKPGAAGQPAVWTAPQQLDADAPLILGNYRPRIAVSGNGHAVVAWMSERACEDDSYEKTPAGKKCIYLHASRRLATDTKWEPAQRLYASPPVTSHDHYARVNTRGDVAVIFPGFYFLTASKDYLRNASMLATRKAADGSYRIVSLEGFKSDSKFIAFTQSTSADLDNSGGLFMAGMSSAPLSYTLINDQSTIESAPSILDTKATSTSAGAIGELVIGNGQAAYTAAKYYGDGSKKPETFVVYSPASKTWLTPANITTFTLWGDTKLVGTDNPDGEFLLFSGCKLTAWRGGAWGATRDLPAYCGRDQGNGIYAFNRKGDYVGLNWAGKPGQWGYYSYPQDKLLKGAPGSGTAVSGDFVLGTSSDSFVPASTQLLLANSGIALAVTTNAYITLPSAANATGVSSGTAGKLWAVYLQ